MRSHLDLVIPILNSKALDCPCALSSSRYYNQISFQ